MSNNPKELFYRLENLNEKLKNQDGGIMAFWTEIRAGRVVDNIKGLSRTAMHNALTELNALELKKHSHSPSRLFQFVERVESAFFIYSSNLASEKKSHYGGNSSFNNKTWALYFFNDNGHGTAELGRIILHITGDGKAKIKNRQGLEDFSGTFQLLNNHVGIFDLHGEEQPGRKFYIQAIMGPVPKEIALGGFINYVRNGVVTGNLILNLVEDLDKILEPALLSWKNNPKDFYKVDPAIRQFLAQRSLNNYQLPNHTFTTQKLALHIKTDRPEKKSSFFNVERPVIFIATPTNSLSKEDYEKNSTWLNTIVQKIKDSLPQVIVHSLRKGQWKIPEYATYITGLETLKQTDFFVLIHPKSEKVSFSLIEVGWALIYCKTVMLFYEKDSIPIQLLELRNTHLNVSVASEIKDLETDQEGIADRIIHEVSQYLEIGNSPRLNT